MAVSKRLRFEILKRDGFRCRYCGAGADEHDLTVDHVIPVTLGGSTEASNLVAACRDCNAGKTSTNLDDQSVQQVAGDALRWARAIKIVAEEMSTDSPLSVDVQIDALLALYEERTENRVPNDARRSIRTFIELGLTPEIIQGHIFRTADRNLFYSASWRYLCGCCWHSVRELQEAAQRLIKAEDEFEQIDPESRWA